MSHPSPLYANPFFPPHTHTARVNVMFHFSPLSFIFFLLHGFLFPNIMYFLTTSLHSSLRFHSTFNYVFFFFSLTHSTLPHVLAPSLTHHTYQPHDPSPSPLQHVFAFSRSSIPPTVRLIPHSLNHIIHCIYSFPFTHTHHRTSFLPFSFHTNL